MMAVVISAAMTSFAGVIYAFYYNNLFPGAGVQHLSVDLDHPRRRSSAASARCSGRSSAPSCLKQIAESMRTLLEWFGIDLPGTKQVFFGVVLLLVVIALPEGVWPWLCTTLRSDGAEAMSALLTVDGVSKRFRGLVAVDRVNFEVAERRDFCGDRAKRRRQDHAVQHDRGSVLARQRHDHFCRASASMGFRPIRSAGAASAAPSRLCGRFRRSAWRTTSSSARCCIGSLCRMRARMRMKFCAGLISTTSARSAPRR